MATPNAFEQLTLELINQARLNPHGEFERWVTNAPANVQNALNFFNVDRIVLKQQFDALQAVAPVAWNLQLGDSAQTHTDLMAAFDQQSHFLPGEPDIGQRIINAGYTGFSNVFENIFAFAQDAVHAHAGFFIDWGNTPTGIQSPPGHRNAIMNSVFTEVGVGHATDAGAVGPNLVTHHFGNRAAQTSQITGVVFNDGDGDRFYDIGEGIGGTTISSASGGSAANWSTGGYNLDLAAGSHTLTFSGPLGTASIKVKLGAENIKVDMFDPGSFRSSTSASLSGGGVAIELIGEKAINANGNGGADLLIGNSANNVLDGKSGADRMIGHEGNDRYYVGNSNDVVIEAKHNGIDHVISTVSFGMSGQHIERLTLAGTADINGGGNGLDNRIIGNSGDNILNGGKGGNDSLTGNGGIDFFRFNSALSSGNVDTITDFTVNVDKIQIDNAIFDEVGTALSASEFVANATGIATNGTQNILYNTSNGRLYYDEDGSGGQARVHFATLDAGLALDHLDFLLM